MMEMVGKLKKFAIFYTVNNQMKYFSFDIYYK